MVARQEQQLYQEERESFDRIHLAQIEEKLMGGTVEDGKSLFIPRSVLHGASLDEVRQAREGQEIVGHFAFLGSEQLRALRKEKRKVALGLPDIDSQTGEIAPDFPLTLIDTTTGIREPMPESMLIDDIEITNGEQHAIFQFNKQSSSLVLVYAV